MTADDQLLWDESTLDVADGFAITYAEFLELAFKIDSN